MSTRVGLQLPVIPLIEVAGNTGTIPLLHIDKLVPKSNCGSKFCSTVTLKLVASAQVPAVGVNV